LAGSGVAIAVRGDASRQIRQGEKHDDGCVRQAEGVPTKVASTAARPMGMS
jgi:hypothetical protein